MVNSKFETEGYSISITGKNLQVTEAIETYVQEKIAKIERFTNNILEIVVTLEVQKLAHKASIIMKFLHFRIQVHSTTEDLYSAIDGSFNKLFKLIRKYKSKLQSHRSQDLSSVDMKVHVFSQLEEIDDINDEIEAETLREEEEKYRVPEIVAKEILALKTLTKEEALMKLDLSGEPFLIYRAEEDQKLRVVYKRKDEKIGLIEIE